mmetsp:Transcript_49185/g.76755  ORF Transcript_49185/g.76755 Transcript_49185/m.76755 type:complete len:278 (-) Transcript_49185:1937-2770(-)
MFEMAHIEMYRAERNWRRNMEEAATLLTRTIKLYSHQGSLLMVARAKARAWIWRSTARLAHEMRSRMHQGESLIDTMKQLSWEAMQEGKSVLAESEKAGDRLIRAEVLMKVIDMQMLGLKEAASVQKYIDDAMNVYKSNSNNFMIARLYRKEAQVRLHSSEYKLAQRLLEASIRLFREGRTAGGIDEAESLWMLSITKRMGGDPDEGRHNMKEAIDVYKRLRISRLCSLCSVHIVGACYTCIECYQRDYCKDCYAECALSGRSCHKTTSMIRATRPL